MSGVNPFDESRAHIMVMTAVDDALAGLGLVRRRLPDGSIVTDVIAPSGPLQLMFRLDPLGTLEAIALFPFPAVVDISDAVVQANLRLRLPRLDFDAPARRVFLRAFVPLAWSSLPGSIARFLVTAILATADLLYSPLAAVCEGKAEARAVANALDDTRKQVDAALEAEAETEPAAKDASPWPTSDA